MKHCEYVYQIAGIISYFKLDSNVIYSTHVEGVRNILDVASELQIKKVVITASTAGIGISKVAEVLNEANFFNISKYKKVMYMYSKYLNIQICKEFSKKGLNVCCVSPTTIYGQGDINMHIGKLIKNIVSGRLKFAPHGGNPVVSVDDIIDAHILVMEKGLSGENYIFAHEFITYFRMYNYIVKLFNIQYILKRIPYWTLFPFIFFTTLLENVLFLFKKKPILSPTSINFLYKNRRFTAKKAREGIGWQPKLKFEKAIIKGIKFYKEQNLL